MVAQLDDTNMDRLLKIRAGQRRIYQMVENMKRRSEDERRELDTHNLTLQSLLYGKDYFLKEVHFCKEYKTPHLQQALQPEVYLQRFKNLPPNVSETQQKQNIVYLGEQLKERKDLTQKLKYTELERKEREAEFRKRQRVLDDFPQILKTLEDATMPLQKYLNVRVTEESNLHQNSEKLPLPMNSIFRKLYNFSKQYPQFGLEVSIESTSEEDIDQFYINHPELTSSQIMYNPRYSHVKQKNPINPISESSKKIKKDKNPH